MWYCRTEKGWRRFPVLEASNGKVRTGVVLVHGKERRYPDGRFQIRTFSGTKAIYQNVDSSASSADALAERNRVTLRMTLAILPRRQEPRFSKSLGASSCVQRQSVMSSVPRIVARLRPQ